jgi:hypothetical protein
MLIKKLWLGKVLRAFSGFKLSKLSASPRFLLCSFLVLPSRAKCNKGRINPLITCLHHLINATRRKVIEICLAPIIESVYHHSNKQKGGKSLWKTVSIQAMFFQKI